MNATKKDHPTFLLLHCLWLFDVSVTWGSLILKEKICWTLQKLYKLNVWCFLLICSFAKHKSCTCVKWCCSQTTVTHVEPVCGTGLGRPRNRPKADAVRELDSDQSGEAERRNGVGVTSGPNRFHGDVFRDVLMSYLGISWDFIDSIRHVMYTHVYSSYF